MLGEKSEVDPREYDKELHLCSTFWQGSTGNSREPECHPGKDGEHGPYRKDVVEMRHDVISIVQGDIQGAIS